MQNKPSRQPLGRCFLCAMIAALVVIGSANFGPASLANDFDATKLQTEITAAIDKVLPAAVAINDRGAIFSGVIVSADGIVLSAGHAVRSNRTYTVILADGRRLQAKGLGTNRRVDMAMLQITDPKDLPFAEMGNSSALVRNQPCVGISHPGMFDSRRGAVVRFGYITKPVTINEGMILSTALMEPGDSGGPLVDLEGKVIGIHSNIRKSATENYDVPIDSFRQYWDELKTPDVFEIEGWPSLPKLGFRGDPTDDGSGVEVLKVYEGGLAEQAGLQPKDIVIDVGGQRVNSARRVYNRLIDLKSTGANQFDLLILRDGKRSKLNFKLSDLDLPVPKSYPELTDLAGQFRTLESRLDDDVFVVHSKINNRVVAVRATRIRHQGSGNLISKSIRVGEKPEIELPGGKRVTPTIIFRDSKNDLVLMQAELPGDGGIDLNQIPGDLQEQPGQLLLTPDSEGKGNISVWGSKYFSVPRTVASGGYLGVILGSRSGSVIFETVQKGAARDAGLQSGDVVLKFNDQPIENTQDVRDFLKLVDPETVITAVVNRGGEEMTKEIVLGIRPDLSGHVADDLEGGKSVRRDGFSLAISHDADLKPEDCGGPVFDLQGQFLGLNISRFSRTRSYVIPKTVLKKFVDDADQRLQARNGSK